PGNRLRLSLVGGDDAPREEQAGECQSLATPGHPRKFMEGHDALRRKRGSENDIWRCALRHRLAGKLRVYHAFVPKQSRGQAQGASETPIRHIHHFDVAADAADRLTQLFAIVVDAATPAVANTGENEDIGWTLRHSAAAPFLPRRGIAARDLLRPAAGLRL